MQETTNISEYRQTLADKILHVAMAAFSERGIRAVKMDDITKSLSISKRTLYEIYANKEALIIEGVKWYYEDMHKRLRDYAIQSPNVMDILIYSFRLKVEEIRQTNPMFYTEIEKYPALLAYFEQMHCDHHSQMLKFLRRGVEEGYFIRDLNYEFVTQMIDMQNRFVMQQMLYQQYSMETIFFNLVFVSLRGFCTTKGIEVLDKFFADYSKEMA